jgi:hypothetical protein
MMLPVLSHEAIESTMLQLPQIECPVAHYFGPGVYIREVKITAGTFAIGHHQKTEHLNVFLQGKVVMFDEFGGMKTLQAPMIFTAPPGRKMGFIIEDVVWLNVYPTTETDIDKLEDTYIEKSDTWREHYSFLQLENNLSIETARHDYVRALEELGTSEQVVRKQSENTTDLADLPMSLFPKIQIRNSQIEGKGIFATQTIEEGEIIGPARILGLRTVLGRYTNHHPSHNAKFVEDAHGDIFLIATKEILGCRGGDQGTEVCVDYRDAYKNNWRILI